MQVKLQPNNDAKISFPGFQRILNFTSVNESSLSVPVNSDTDLEYLIFIFSNTTDFDMRFNFDSGNNYGSQYIKNNATDVFTGPIAARATGQSSCASITGSSSSAITIINILAPVGFIKTVITENCSYTSTTVIEQQTNRAYVYNSTSNLTSINFVNMDSTAGTNILIYARRTA